MEQLKTEMNNTREWCYNTRRRRAFIKEIWSVLLNAAEWPRK